jgi:hypothetical protein
MKNAPLRRAGRFNYSRRRSTLPPARAGSTIDPEGLNGRVRDGNGCFPLGKATGNSWRQSSLTKVRATPPLRERGSDRFADNFIPEVNGALILPYAFDYPSTMLGASRSTHPGISNEIPWEFYSVKSHGRLVSLG